MAAQRFSHHWARAFSRASTEIQRQINGSLPSTRPAAQDAARGNPQPFGIIKSGVFHSATDVEGHRLM